MNFSQFSQLSTENLLLKQIDLNDQLFIEDIFQDLNIKKYYIVPKEAQQNYKKIIKYWLNDISKEAGCAWIIIEKSKGFFSKR